MSARGFIDTSDECIICLAPFSQEDQKELVLSCGHRYHLACIQEQLQHAQPNPAKRLLFNGTRCAKCDQVCQHPSLSGLTRTTDALRKKVDDLILEQVGSADMLDEGRRTFAYYLCGFCREPYFGGTIDCADTAEGELPPEDRLCPKCSPKANRRCSDPAQHRAYHVWKCRYCCEIASHVCYGTVHFCNACHDRNTQRVRRKQRKLEPRPCLGRESCRHPMQKDHDFHMNGSKPDCEHVYYCAWCESSSRAERVEEEAPGSRNLIQNPSGQFGSRHWQRVDRFRPFQVEQSDIPVDEHTHTNFVSGFQWSVMAQVIDLQQIVRDPSQVALELSCKIMARTDCPSVFRMEVVLSDSRHRPVLRQQTAEILAPPDGWELVKIDVPPTRNAAHVAMIICGKDARFWQGMYGSKVALCRVRVLGMEQELNQVMLADRNNMVRDVGVDRGNGRNLPREQMLIALLLVPIAMVFFWLIS